MQQQFLRSGVLLLLQLPSLLYSVSVVEMAESSIDDAKLIGFGLANLTPYLIVPSVIYPASGIAL